jgi:hypothetical protein
MGGVGKGEGVSFYEGLEGLKVKRLEVRSRDAINRVSTR